MLGPTSNRACVLAKAMVLEVRDLPVPDITDDSEDILVRVESTGICGSDIHNYTDGGVGPHVVTEPLILGHESAGVVVKVGSRVKAISIGDHVAVEPLKYCRKCQNCKIGRVNVCRYYKQASAAPVDGTLCQYYVCEEDLAVKIPTTLSWEIAGCIQPVAIAVQVAKRAKFTAGQTIAVFGCGPLGYLIMAVARVYGVSKILAFGRSQKRMDFVKKSLADFTFTTPPKPDRQSYADWAENFKRTSLNEAGMDPSWGVDIAIEASGAEACMHAGASFVHAGGRYVQVGFGNPDSTFPTMQVLAKELDMVGSVRYNTGCFDIAIELLASGKVDVRPLIASVFPLTRSEEAFETMLKGDVMKVVIMNQL